ncbi:COX15/CtaA family protein [Cesiribacter andamanensis]|uniref:Heme A synthase n=1 Tax=Cesiribacter andamanensis AMV16 TaxID=1279009 RepID=M7NK33_9BACT|nr:COX15/CtaA family protein [Cesiribacter andamanensis]EMR02140.1 Heme A synthase [Cesiribacter andamanensis AMV16]
MLHTTHPTLIKVWLWSGIGLISLMIAIGGITRLTGSGLSIVEWKLISGTLPPLNQTEWQQAFESYKQFPEYQKINFAMSLQDFKGIFWWEYIHRFLGRLIGLVFLLPFVYFLWRCMLSRLLIRRLLLILLVGALQGGMGWLMVKSGLVELPHVSHYRLAAHLSLALLLIGLLLWTLEDLKPRPAAASRSGRFYPLAGLLLVLISMQIILGAFVAGLKSGFSYNTFPLMGDQWLPAHAFSAPMDLLENGVLVQFIHRWFAFGVLAVALGLAYSLRKATSSAPLQTLASWLLLVLGVQIVLGILTLLLQVPLLLGVLHQMMAVLLFGLAVVLLYQVRAANRGMARGAL